MSYISVHHKRDGSVERKRVTVTGHSGKDAERISREHHNEKMKRMRDDAGWSRDRKHKLKYSIPAVVYEEVFINDGPEAARDGEWLARRAEELGYQVRPKRRRR
jgi:hypothetical protein